LEFPLQAAVLKQDATFRSGTEDFQIEDSQSVPTRGVTQRASLAAFAQSPNNTILAASDADGVSTLLQDRLYSSNQNNGIGTDFYRTSDDFTQGLVIEGKGVAMKVGGYVKLDMIQDLNAIDNTDIFDVSSIPVGGPQRTNNRMHVRQTRLNFDTRWETEAGGIKSFVEGDFFGTDDNGNQTFRLRQAYGELGRFLGGQTFTTFANIAASPATLDFEGAISTISIRRAQLRWTQPVFTEDLTLALALEDSSTAIELPPGSNITGNTRTITPDLVARLRRTSTSGNMQIAGIARILGFQPTGDPVITDNAWGINFSQVQDLSPDDKIYWQINYGDGIASLLGGLPDVTPVGTDDAALLGYFGWMIGTTHEWNSKLSSNFTFAESHFQNTSGQLSTDINNLTYLAANVIWTPLERFEFGVEYLYGKREDISGESGIANRIQFAVFYYLP
jgi:hypothetical protein